MKKTKTFTIDENLLEEFIEISKKKSINKSLFIENSIRDFIEKYKNENDFNREGKG